MPPLTSLQIKLEETQRQLHQAHTKLERCRETLSLTCAAHVETRAERAVAIKRAEVAEARLKYHHASYPLPKKPPQPVQLGDDYNPDLCRFCREADWEAPAEAQARQKEGSDG